MLVGIGFIAILTAAIAQKFLQLSIAQEVEAATHKTELDIASAEAHALTELRELQRRLRDLKDVIRRLAEHSTASSGD